MIRNMTPILSASGILRNTSRSIWTQFPIQYRASRTSSFSDVYKRQHRQAGAGTHGKAHRADETGAGYYGAVKGGKRFGMDTENE